ncbi:MAG: hypothetical protein NZ555_06840 [Geminicoccaceae bacterium]|nr:hypothetical protein [Geminicoccaceae bacterium]MDW8370591.1 hypothetical protein [Geminicoccaceae bacterium]
MEFCHQHVAAPQILGYHEFFKHHHYKFDDASIAEGRASFRKEINDIFRLNGLAYELEEDGAIRRLSPPVLGEPLERALFATGDAELDRLLETARKKSADPRIEVRREALEKLWDAWERSKTLGRPDDKKHGVTLLLDRGAGTKAPCLRSFLEKDARDLTDIGNRLTIRHTETDTEPIERAEHVDYLFMRLFNMIWLLLGRR